MTKMIKYISLVSLCLLKLKWFRVKQLPIELRDKFKLLKIRQLRITTNLNKYKYRKIITSYYPNKLMETTDSYIFYFEDIFVDISLIDKLKINRIIINELHCNNCFENSCVKFNFKIMCSDRIDDIQLTI